VAVIPPDRGAPFAPPGGGPTRSQRRRPRVSSVIIDELRADIASGRLPLGSRMLNERDLAARFNVSQPTIREVIRALDAMGLVEVRHGSGAYVTDNVGNFVASTLNTVLQMGDVGVIEALDIRQVLGTYSAERASAQATEADLAAMRVAEEACTTADSVQGMAQAVVSFQATCSAAAHNPLLFTLETFLIKILMQLQLVAEGGRGVEFWRHQTSRFAPQRHRLLEGIAAGDSAEAVEAMRDYLAKQRAWFMADAQMSQVKLSDPALVWAVNEIFLQLPDYGANASTA
jgi:GntR family transcriptional repressor for pyruvate dehydrogenase complex